MRADKQFFVDALRWEERFCNSGKRLLMEAADPPAAIQTIIDGALREVASGPQPPQARPPQPPAPVAEAGDVHARLAGAFLAEGRPVSDVKTDPLGDAPRQPETMEAFIAGLKEKYGPPTALPERRPYVGTYRTLAEQQTEWAKTHTPPAGTDPHAVLAGAGPTVPPGTHALMFRSVGV
jgi:hypothetical protein